MRQRFIINCRSRCVNPPRFPSAILHRRGMSQPPQKLTLAFMRRFMDNNTIQPRHTHTVWSNEVFTLTDNRNYKDLRVQIKPNYQWPNMLGNRETQKSLSCSKYGDARENPTVTKMLLEAWSLWRLTWGNGRFLKEHPDIAKQRETDVEKLKEITKSSPDETLKWHCTKRASPVAFRMH